MAALPHTTSQLSLHLSDRALTPILSSSQSPSTGPPRRQSQTQAQALSALTTTAISAFDSAFRLGLGIPQRVMIETTSAGPIILQSYLNPPPVQRFPSAWTSDHDNESALIQETRENLLATLDPEPQGTPEETAEALVNGTTHDGGPRDDDTEGENAMQPPLLIAMVIASRSADIREARRAAAHLERTGREFQRQWSQEQGEAACSPTVMDTEADDG